MNGSYAHIFVHGTRGSSFEAVAVTDISADCAVGYLSHICTHTSAPEKATLFLYRNFDVATFAKLI